MISASKSSGKLKLSYFTSKRGGWMRLRLNGKPSLLQISPITFTPGNNTATDYGMIFFLDAYSVNDLNSTQFESFVTYNAAVDSDVFSIIDSITIPVVISRLFNSNDTFCDLW